MWRILKAELSYHRVNFLVFLILVPPILIYAAYSPSFTPLIIVWLMPFLAVNNWNALRIREKRDFQLIQLPVPVRQLAVARMLMIILAPVVFLGFYSLLHSAVNPGGTANVRVLLTLYGTIVLIFSLAFMFRDRFLGSKLLKQGKMAIVALGVLLLAVNVYGLFTFRRAAAEPGGESPAIMRALVYVFENNPSTTTMRTVVFLAISLALALLTIATFSRRRTYIE